MRRIPTIVLLAAATACGGGSDGPSAPAQSFAIDVAITTTGAHLDIDGYGISLDGGSAQFLGVNASLRLTPPQGGAHTIELSGVQENCTVEGGASRTVDASNAAAVTFAVRCSAVPLELVFASSRAGSAIEVWNMKADGSKPHVRIIDGEGVLVSASADGSRIAFNSPRSGNPEIFIVNADGTGLRNLTQHTGTDASATFAPDGTKLVFMSNRDGPADIFVMNVDGTGVTNLTRSAAFENEPHWCSNGRIVFTRNELQKADLYTMKSDGSDVRRLTTDDVVVNTPRWSPDCSRIAFASIRHAGAAGHPRNDLDLYVINADGSNLQRLTSTAAFDVTPAWSPDGRRIAFATERDGNAEVYVMNADGSGVTNLTRNPANDQSPFWVR